MNHRENDKAERLRSQWDVTAGKEIRCPNCINDPRPCPDCESDNVDEAENHFCFWCEKSTPHKNIHRRTTEPNKGMITAGQCTKCGTHKAFTD
jgi:hypothetical protein